MTGSVAAPGSRAAALVELRRAPLVAIQAIDLRAARRDFWADEAALWDRLIASWAGLDDAAWRLPGAAPSDAGGPDWGVAPSSPMSGRPRCAPASWRATLVC
jgi:hypothetical protein